MPEFTSKIAPCLWFDTQAEEAARFYVETFRRCGQPASFGKLAYYGDAGPGPKDTVLTATFSLAGQDFMAVNGGPHFTLSPAISMMVSCADQAEVDRFWDGLMAGGGTPSQCGWLTDKYGLSWQVVPSALGRMMHDPDRTRADRVMAAILKMIKLDIAGLEAAYRA